MKFAIMRSVLTKNQTSQKCLVHKEKAVANGGRRAGLSVNLKFAGSAAVPSAAAAAEAAALESGRRTPADRAAWPLGASQYHRDFPEGAGRWPFRARGGGGGASGQLP